MDGGLAAGVAVIVPCSICHAPAGSPCVPAFGEHLDGRSHIARVLDEHEAECAARSDEMVRRVAELRRMASGLWPVVPS